MKRAFLCALAALLAALLVPAFTASPSEARRSGVRLDQPRFVDGYDKVRLAGAVRGHGRVRIQRFARAKQRWVTVKRVRVRQNGRFKTLVRAADRRRAFRVAAGRHRSPRKVVPPAPKPAAAPSDACGKQPRKSDGTYWACTLAENFDGSALDRTLWRSATGFLGGSEPARPCYVDDPSVIAVQNGTLRLSARKIAEPIQCPGTKADPTGYIAGGVNTYRLFSQKHGRFEARYKSTATNQVGLHEAFWLWPDDRYNTAIWPAAGEIDIAETYSQYPNLSIPFLHYTWNDNWGPVPGLNTAWNCSARRGEYNTFALEWTAERLEILVNGRTCLVNTSGDPAFQKPYIVALTQLMGTGANMYDGRAPLPATMTVDYVRVWK